jgi:hypothetical protein
MWRYARDASSHRAILTELLAAFGEGSEIRPPFYCNYGYQTSIGARCCGGCWEPGTDHPDLRGLTAGRN